MPAMQTLTLFTAAAHNCKLGSESHMSRTLPFHTGRALALPVAKHAFPTFHNES